MWNCEKISKMSLSNSDKAFRSFFEDTLWTPLKQLQELHQSQSFVPNAVHPIAGQETVHQSVQHRQATTNAITLMWPSISGTPINEITTEGYFSMAFPTLFPTAAADILGQCCNQVTIGNYFKHLLMYVDCRFATHPCFRFFSLDTEMQWCALQAGRIYIRQHPGDAQLSLDVLSDMVALEGEAFSNRVIHYAARLRGTKQYWFRQRSRLVSMVIGLPTIFFTHSAADLQWPEFAQLICPEDPESRSSRTTAVIQNPAIADWFFWHRVQKFIEVGILGATDYWMRFEWQHRGSPHVHGLAWLSNAPNVEELLTSADKFDIVKEQIITYADEIVSTINPAVLPNG